MRRGGPPPPFALKILRLAVGVGERLEQIKATAISVEITAQRTIKMVRSIAFHHALQDPFQGTYAYFFFFLPVAVVPVVSILLLILPKDGLGGFL